MQPVRVAEEPVVLAAPVVHIADDGMPDVLEVTANLVKASRTRERFDDGVSARRMKSAVVCDGCHALAPLAARHRMIDCAVVGRHAARHGEIALDDLSVFERVLYRRCDVRPKRKEQHAARSAIEAMDRKDLCPSEGACEIECADAVVCQTAMNQQARGLVDGDQMLVAKEHIE